MPIEAKVHPVLGSRTFVATRSGSYWNIEELGYNRRCGNIGGAETIGALSRPSCIRYEETISLQRVPLPAVRCASVPAYGG